MRISVCFSVSCLLLATTQVLLGIPDVRSFSNVKVKYSVQEFDLSINSLGGVLSIDSDYISKIDDVDTLLLGLGDETTVDQFEAARVLRVKDVYYSVFVKKNRESLNRRDFPLFRNTDDSDFKDQAIARLATHLIKNRNVGWSLEDVSKFHLSVNATLNRKGLYAHYMGPLATDSEESIEFRLSWKVTLDQPGKEETILFIKLLTPDTSVTPKDNRTVLTTGKKRKILLDNIKASKGILESFNTQVKTF